MVPPWLSIHVALNRESRQWECSDKVYSLYHYCHSEQDCKSVVVVAARRPLLLLRGLLRWWLVVFAAVLAYYVVAVVWIEK